MISRAALPVSCAIQRLSVSLADLRVEARHGHAAVHLGEAAAFHSLVAKLR